MNSLPFISHHLFVAAIGNEGRAQVKPTRQERPCVETADPASAIALEAMNDRKPLLDGAARHLQTSVARVRC
jgi:hypothetical protein